MPTGPLIETAKLCYVNMNRRRSELRRAHDHVTEIRGRTFKLGPAKVVERAGFVFGVFWLAAERFKRARGVIPDRPPRHQRGITRALTMIFDIPIQVIGPEIRGRFGGFGRKRLELTKRLHSPT